MWSRVYFISAFLFLVVMNALLWHSEYGRKGFSNAVPVETVVRRLLESADDSNLEIRRRGEKIGYCRWAPGPLAPPPSAAPGGDPSVPEGMVSRVIGYEINFDGSVSLSEDHRLRFNFNLQVHTNYLWKQVQLRLILRPWKWEIQAQAESQSLQLTLTEDNQVRHHQFTFADLQDPARLLRVLGVPWPGEALGWLEGMTAPLSASAQPWSMDWGLEWDARADRQKIGYTPLSVYRVHTRLLDQYDLTVYLLQSGEILRIELPEGVVMVNDELVTR